MRQPQESPRAAPHVPLQRSRYNFFVERMDGIVGYNARTGVFALLSANVAALLRDNVPLEGVQDEEELVSLGFLHYGNELDLVRQVFEAGPQADVLHLTIAPTLQCNFECNYCYQNEYRTSNIMSSEVCDGVLRFVRQQIRSGRTKIILDWYGGEPLLASDIIVDLMAGLHTVLSTESASFDRVRVITNGLLLDRVMAERLRAAGVNQAQISVDALHYEHPSKRGVLNVDGSPSPILRNAIECGDVLDVGIRVNVSTTAAARIDELVNALSTLGFGSRYYLARVEDFTSEHQPRPPVHTKNVKRLPIVQGHGDSLSRKAFADLEIATMLRTPEGLRWVQNKLEPQHGHFCSATAQTMAVISPDGYISRCWESVGDPAQAVGHVLADTECPESHDASRKWSTYTPLAYPTCSSCKVLPLCMGGCSYPRLFMGAQTPPCESIKRQISECVTQLGRRLKLDVASENLNAT